MALRNPPTFLQAGQHPAENTRLALSGVLGSPQGVFAGGVISDSVADGDPGHGRVLPDDFKVTENDTPNMSVNVAAGAAWIRGTESATQGSYHVILDDTENLVIDVADATNARIDLVVVRVKDEDYSGSDNEVVLEVVTGTAAASPVDPAVPDNALVLARVTVPALASSITDGDITDFAITPVGLRFAGRLVFATVGTATFTKADYPWLRAVNVKAIGGGGGGGGIGVSANNSSAGGGGGGYAESLVLASSIGASETVTVGAGGAGGAAGFTSGADGGTSSFGTLVAATGGGGGQSNDSGDRFGGAGGVGTAGALILLGGGGGPGSPFSRSTGAGGNSVLGGGGRGATRFAGAGAVTGGTGGIPGGGGAGAACVTTGAPGAAGGSGIVIVDLYA